MKVLSIFGAFIFAFLWASAASAAIYSWTDENGLLHFTNVAPPPQARVVSAREKTVDERLKSAENRADDLEQDLDQAKEEAREALQRARALEERLAEASRLAEEAQTYQEASYRYEETWEEEYSRSPYYGGYVYRAAPYRRPYVCTNDRWRVPRKSHLRKARYKKPYYGTTSRVGLKNRRYGIGINSARTQSERIFNQSRSNPLRSNFISRRAIY
ncbi:MAG: DUF4124 domain-containing protein [Deltaproteobacteria bacterium]|nr:DUF4124 domain-containing protein [Deltaproteobacteria bacterium]